MGQHSVLAEVAKLVRIFSQLDREGSERIARLRQAVAARRGDDEGGWRDMVAVENLFAEMSEAMEVHKALLDKLRGDVSRLESKSDEFWSAYRPNHSEWREIYVGRGEWKAVLHASLLTQPHVPDDVMALVLSRNHTCLQRHDHSDHPPRENYGTPFFERTACNTWDTLSQPQPRQPTISRTSALVQSQKLYEYLAADHQTKLDLLGQLDYRVAAEDVDVLAALWDSRPWMDAVELEGRALEECLGRATEPLA